jgi:hypothetical protein
MLSHGYRAAAPRFETLEILHFLLAWQFNGYRPWQA